MHGNVTDRLMEQVELVDYLREARETVERIKECQERRDAIDRQIRDLENEKEQVDAAESELRSRLESRKRDATEAFVGFLDEVVDGVLD